MKYSTEKREITLDTVMSIVSIPSRALSVALS